MSLTARRTPALGGFNLTFLTIEIRRLLRNRRTVLISLVIPVALYLLFRSNQRLSTRVGADFQADEMIGLAVYGAMLAATSGGATVSIERALGWSRQLNLTPLRPVAYVAMKIITAMLLGLLSVVVLYIAGGVDGVKMSSAQWVETGLLAWLGTIVFAAFGLFMGYLLPSENVMQFIAPILAVLALLGGVLVPIQVMPTSLQNLAPWTPTYGVAQLARMPFDGTSFDPTWLLSVGAWAAALAIGAAVLFRRDTRRT